MTTTIHQALGEFIDAWNAGLRPDAHDYLARVDPSERDALARHLETWLDVAPNPDYDEATRARIAAEPPLVAALEAGRLAELPLPERVTTLRERAGLALGEVAARIVDRFGLSGAAAADRTADYLDRLEREELDEDRLSRRLLDGLARVLGGPPEALTTPVTGMRAAPALGQVFQRSEDHAGDEFVQEIEALSDAAMTPAPEPMDDVDRLFLGGPEG